MNCARALCLGSHSGPVVGALAQGLLPRCPLAETPDHVRVRPPLGAEGYSLYRRGSSNACLDAWSAASGVVGQSRRSAPRAATLFPSLARSPARKHCRMQPKHGECARRSRRHHLRSAAARARHSAAAAHPLFGQLEHAASELRRVACSPCGWATEVVCRRSTPRLGQTASRCSCHAPAPSLRTLSAAATRSRDCARGATLARRSARAQPRAGDPRRGGAWRPRSRGGERLRQGQRGPKLQRVRHQRVARSPRAGEPPLERTGRLSERVGGVDRAAPAHRDRSGRHP